MKLVKIIGVILLVLVALAVIMGLVKSGPYSVSESADIKTSPEVAWKNISDLKQFAVWNPWNKLDTNVQRSFGGEPGTVGSSYSWQGNKDVGKGMMKHKEVVDGQKVVSDLYFYEPFEDHSVTTFSTTPNADGTQKVTWTIEGENDFPMSIMTALMGFEGMMRKSFQEGLANMQKKIDEDMKNAPPAMSGEVFNIEEKQFAGQTYITFRKEINMSDITQFFSDNFHKMGELMEKNKIPMTGSPCGIYYKYDMEKGITDMAAAMPVAPGSKLDGYTTVDVPAATPYYHLNYHGDYAKMAPAYEALDKYAKSKGREPAPYMVIEEYTTDPMMEKDTTKWLTQIHYFLK